MKPPDIHTGLSLDDSLAYREVCQERYWDLMDQLSAASIAIAAISNHIQLIGEQHNGA